MVGAEPSAFELKGTHRFEVLRCIGAGGMLSLRDRHVRKPRRFAAANAPALLARG